MALLETAFAQEKTVNGLVLPADAAPYSDQVLRVPCDNTRNETTFDSAVTIYQVFGCGGNLFGDTLVDLDKDFNPRPPSLPRRA